MNRFGLNLNVKVTLLIGVVLLLGMTLTYLGLQTYVERLRKDGIRQAKMINRLVFEALYASMRAGSGREGNHEVAKRLQRMEQIRQIRLIHGPLIDRQYGVEEDETPADEAERRALRGKEVVEMVRVDGQHHLRTITPLFVKVECQRCHQAQVGEVNGAISTTISLRELDAAVARSRSFLISIAIVGLVLPVLLLAFFLHRSVVGPLKRLTAAAHAIGQGELDVRVEMKTKDEIGELSRSINQMTDNLKRAWEEIDQKNLQLKRHAGTLEQRVAERTAALLESQEELRRRRDFVLRVAQDLEERGIRLREETEELKERLIESQKLATLGRMGAKIAHEINNPLTAILVRAQLRGRAKDEGTQRDFETIEREAKRIAAITQGYLNLSKPRPATKAWSRLEEILDEVLESMTTLGMIKRCEIVREYAGNLPAVWVDQDQLHQVYRNLITNAAHAMADRPQQVLTVGARRSEDRGWVETYIRDTGTGIPQEDLEKIFHHYFTTKPEGRGTGLGLAVVKDIVEKQHQGRVEVESEWGKGATFHVRLPIQEGIAAKEGDASKEKPEGQPFTFTPERFNMLAYLTHNPKEDQPFISPRSLRARARPWGSHGREAL